LELLIKEVDEEISQVSLREPQALPGYLRNTLAELQGLPGIPSGISVTFESSFVNLQQRYGATEIYPNRFVAICSVPSHGSFLDCYWVPRSLLQLLDLVLDASQVLLQALETFSTALQLLEIALQFVKVERRGSSSRLVLKDGWLSLLKSVAAL
jgi:hypothetical protein